MTVQTRGQLRCQLGYGSPGEAPAGASSSYMAPQSRNSTQRERLLNGMVELAARHGYAGATVSAVIAEARVSRPTFYENFADRDACFVAAIESLQAELLASVSAALELATPTDALARAVGSVLDFAAAAPSKARFLMGESMSGGRKALDARDAAIGQLAEEIETVQRGATAKDRLPDIDPRVVLGSVYRMLAMRMRRGETAVGRLAEDLTAWIAAYDAPAGGRRWQVLAPGAVSSRSEHVPSVPIEQMPSIFPRGRPRVAASEIAENHRLRILWAAARLAEEKGYIATTVADITRVARIEGRVFYKLFSDKQDAFTAAHELGFQRVMDVTTKAFFAAEKWPERSWEAVRALTQLLQDNPLVAHVGFVEAYAVGPGAVQRIEDSHTAFLFFLQEGLVHAPEQDAPSRVAMEAVISSIFEVIYLQARVEGEPQIAAMLGYIAHLWLTPFLGVKEANAFIARRLGASKPRRRAQK
jgi:AcrR family transcriptional regulator